MALVSDKKKEYVVISKNGHKSSEDITYAINKAVSEGYRIDGDLIVVPYNSTLRYIQRMVRRV